MLNNISRKPDLTGWVTVRLRAEARLEAEVRTLAEHAKSRGLSGVLKVLPRLGNPRTEPLITAVPLGKLLEMERAAAQTEFPPLRSLTQYWRIDLRDREPDEIEAALAQLRRAREIELVEEEVMPVPALNPGDDPFNSLQGYQGPAPAGIDAQYMWALGIEGAGINVVDIEGGWNVTHEDLVGKVTPALITGFNSTVAGWRDHGTAVLGVIAATDNVVGVMGTAPSVQSVRMSSIFIDAAGNANVANAFAAPIAALTVGDIMLIELQTGGSLLPMETDPAILDLLRLATSQGILVVEAAGNGNNDLDVWAGTGGDRLDRNSVNFVDSGALMVGAAVSTVPHDRASFSNYGSRIDCYGWGYNVATCGYGQLTPGALPNQQYTSQFNGTSSASPIIVSAAALVQSHYKAVAGNILSPTELRTILSNPATGTAQGTGTPGAIGVMPNLALIAQSLGTVMDVYVRDAVGDPGIQPWLGNLCESPDVIVRFVQSTSPQNDFGTIAVQDSTTLGSDVEAGQDNYVYVRMRNRGGIPAANVVATVYWSPPATLASPSLWNKIGSVTVPNVPVGNILTVSDAIVWPSAAVPPVGHYCFIAILHHPQDPAPIDPTNFPAMSAGDFVDMIRNQNNVTWRNFNVVDNLPTAPVAFPFLMTGMDARTENFVLQVERRLPRDAKLILHGPAALILRLRNVGRDVKIDREGNAQIVLPALPLVNLGEVPLGGRVRHRCRLSIVPGREKIAWGHGAAVRQLFEGREIGRIGWQFAQRARIGGDVGKLDVEPAGTAGKKA